MSEAIEEETRAEAADERIVRLRAQYDAECDRAQDLKRRLSESEKFQASIKRELLSIVGFGEERWQDLLKRQGEFRPLADPFPQANAV